VFASKSGTQILPAGAAAAAPFDGVNTTTTVGEFRLAPILIAPRQSPRSDPLVASTASDALVIMAGNSGKGETAVDFDSMSGASKLTLKSTISFAADDIILVTDPSIKTATGAPCMIQQVSAAASGVAGKVVNLAGAYASDSIGTASLSSTTDKALALNLGNIAGGNPPSFLMIGVGANNTLFSYDLLKTTSTPMLPIADGVFEMHVLYGVDNNNDGTIDAWVDPNTTTTHTLAALMAGTETASGLLQSIKAVRVGLITRTSLPEKATVAPAALTLFSDLGMTYTRTLSAAEQLYRYRTIESTIPIRNSMLLN
jgi:type IV pilus assembly protein PilW